MDQKEIEEKIGHDIDVVSIIGSYYDADHLPMVLLTILDETLASKTTDAIKKEVEDWCLFYLVMGEAYRVSYSTFCFLNDSCWIFKKRYTINFETQSAAECDYCLYLRYENDKRFKKGALVQCCLKKAADLQLRIACYDYAKRLLDGDEVPADLPLAQYYAGLAADKGYSPAFALLSRCAQKQGNEESRLAFLKKGIDANDGECCALYGEILENQNDFAGAEAYYKKAYGHLDPEGTYDYARTFIGTSFGHIDKKEAERIYLEACDLGSAKACEDLGRHYLNGVFGENRLEDAKTIFDKGFGQSGSVICLYEICRIEAFLSKVPGDYGFAEDGFKTLLEDCHYAKAAGCLGDMALNENIQRKDCHRALAFYLAGARLKDAYSALRVGEMLRVGEGVKANPTKAVEYFILAGDCGDPDGYDDAAEMYEKGQKIPMDKSKAKELRDKSAILKSKQK